MVINNIDNNGFFSYNNHLFCLYLYNRSIDEISSLLLLNNYMLRENIHINKIILNKFNKPLTYYEKKYYVLLQINYEYQDGFFHFIKCPNIKSLNILNRNDWAYLWSIKIDYIEYQISHLENSYPLINDSINYYIGLSENAICYFKLLFLDNVPLYINHRRINEKGLYNPIELINDYKVRDMAEYIKICFFQKNKTIYDIKKIINNIKLGSIDYLLLYTRMLYPSYYFDIYERIINDNLLEQELNSVINLIDEYEKLLFEIYVIIKDKTNIIGIDWINKKYL